MTTTYDQAEYEKQRAALWARLNRATRRHLEPNNHSAISILATLNTPHGIDAMREPLDGKNDPELADVFVDMAANLRAIGFTLVDVAPLLDYAREVRGEEPVEVAS